jgi:hypothetical protein
LNFERRTIEDVRYFEGAPGFVPDEEVHDVLSIMHPEGWRRRVGES